MAFSKDSLRVRHKVILLHGILSSINPLHLEVAEQACLNRQRVPIQRLLNVNRFIVRPGVDLFAQTLDSTSPGRLLFRKTSTFRGGISKWTSIKGIG